MSENRRKNTGIQSGKTTGKSRGYNDAWHIWTVHIYIYIYLFIYVSINTHIYIYINIYIYIYISAYIHMYMYDQQLLDVFAKLPIELDTMPGFDCHLCACWERVDASGFFDSHHFVFHMFLLLDYRRSINAI